MQIPHDVLARLFALVHAALATNILLAVSTLPFLLALVSGGRAWPLLALTAPLCAPALAAAFAVFAGPADGDDGPWRTFVRSWRHCLRPALCVGTAATTVFVVLGVDIAFFWGRRAGAVAIPVLASLMLLALTSAVTALALIAERPEVPVHRALVAGLVLGVRRWYLTALSLVVLASLGMLLTTRPSALGIAAAPLLYVVWANSSYALGPGRRGASPPTTTSQPGRTASP
jgi:uncharacterized membrane protein YesL